MNNKAVTLSILMAVLAVFFVQSYVSSIEEEAKKKFGTEVLVVKIKKDVLEQETLNEADLELSLVPKSFLEPGAVFFEGRDADSDSAKTLIKDLTGTVAVVPMQKGEQLTFNKVIAPGIRTGLSPQVALGKRAISIPVNEVTGVSKLIKPGDRVDLIAILEGSAGRENKLVKTILQDVVVLSVGRSVTNNPSRVIEKLGSSGKERVRSLTTDSNFASVTLEVDPNQAQLVALVMSNGDNSLTLSLRNNEDTEQARTGSFTLRDVLGAEAARIMRTPAGQQR